MTHDDIAHQEIVGGIVGQVLIRGELTSIITEFRGDGCVTWTERS